MERESTTSHLLNLLKSAVSQFPDNRGSNSFLSMRDIGMSAFSVFHMQSPSFLHHQEEMRRTLGCDNATTLYGIEKIPGNDQIRRVLDVVSPDYLTSVYTKALSYLEEQGKLKEFDVPDSKRLIAFDGTEYFRSENIHCEHCGTSQKKGVIQYHHRVLNPVIVHPDKPYALPLVPEFITPQDGDKKQDCENKAVKRWLDAHGEPYSKGSVIYLGDDLYSKTTVIEKVLSQSQSYIFTCKPSSHKYLYESLAVYEASGDIEVLEQKKWTGRQHMSYTCRFINECDLTADEKTQKVNWAELQIHDENGKKKKHFSFVTDIRVNEDNVCELIAYGRARWKIENEANNTLKNAGYHLEHNFGHGKQYLSRLLLSFNLIAFLFHSIEELCHSNYRELRYILPTRRTFFRHIETLSCYLIFENWDVLIEFMLKSIKKRRPPPPDNYICRLFVDSLD